MTDIMIRTIESQSKR